MPDPSTTLVAIAFTFLVAGAVKGVIGMGLPTVAMGLLALVMPPAQAAALLVVPSLVTNLWQALAGPAMLPVLKRLSTMLAGIAVGTFASIGFITGSTAPIASALLGAVLAAYAAAGLLKLRFSVTPATERWMSPAVGLVTGALTGATGVFVVPAVPYLNSLGLGKDPLIQALGLSFTVSTLALGGALLLDGAYPSSVATASLLAVVPAVLGMHLGQRLRDRLSPEVFRRWFFVALLLVGLYMLVRALRTVLG